MSLSREDKEIRKKFHKNSYDFHVKQANKHFDELIRLIREELDNSDSE